MPQKILKVFIAMLILSMSVGTVVAQTYLYCGYVRFGVSGNAGKGVLATIYTITPPGSGINTYVLMTNVILSYSNSYFLEVGYASGLNTLFVPKYFTEIQDQDHGYIRHYFSPGPSAGQIHIYQLNGEMVSGRQWTYYVDISPLDTYYPIPYTAVDNQAFFECLVYWPWGPISCEGSHFYNLCYINNGHAYSWTTHGAHADPPYSITDCGHTEFYGHGP